MKSACDIVRGERRVTNMLTEGKHLLVCFSNPNEEQFDQTFRKFVLKQYQRIVKTYFKEITKS